MLRYSIARLARGNRAKGTRVKLGAIHARPSTVAAYLSALRRMLRELRAKVVSDLIPIYRPVKIIGDADSGAFDAFRSFASLLSRNIAATAMRILNLEKVRHTKEFMNTARKTLGIDLSSVIADDDLTQYMETATNRNTGLIRSLSDQVANDVEQVILRNTLQGNSVKTLKEELKERFDIADGRAQLIARDQVAKFNSDLNQVRQQQAEIEKYEWLTSSDERVRPKHVACSGTVYKWGQPTGAEGGLPPGQPIRCRCVAVAIVEF